MTNDETLFLTLDEIIKGYSEVDIATEKAYIKHFGIRDELTFARVYNKYLDLYKKRGLPTVADRLAFLKEEGDWTEKDDAELAQNRRFLDTLLKTKAKIVLNSQIREIEKTIKDTEDKIRAKSLLRRQLLGATCEDRAERKRDEFQIISSIFKDEALSQRYVTDEDYDYGDSEALEEVFDSYYKVFNRFSDENLKKIAITPMFFNLFGLCPKDSPFLFFDKRILDLTAFQQKLLFLAQNARSIFENVPDIPDECKNNYDALVDFALRQRGSKPSSGKEGNMGKTIVGAKSDDLKRAGVNTTGAITPFQMLKESGKRSLNKKDFLKVIG